MPPFLGWEAKGFRDSLGRFARRSPLMVSRRREAMRDAGRTTVKAMRFAAPKKTGEFARGIVFKTFERPGSTVMKVYATGEHAFLLPLIRYGTDPHPIPKGGSAEMMAKGYPLRFYWEKGPRGPGIYRFWSVNHPGTDPNPFVDETVAEIEPEILEGLRRAAASVARMK